MASVWLIVVEPIAMNTVQTNVRVPLGDKPLVRAVAARLRIEPRFRERLKALIEEDPTPALQQRIERLEEQVEWLLSSAERRALPPHVTTEARVRPGVANGSPGA
jgi:ATP phosphoribosyltransferase regulatory subunit HisZ